MPDSNTILVILSMIAATTAVIVGMFVLLARRMKHRDAYNRHSQLESMRRMIEEKLYEVNARLMATEDRWRDVNHLLIASQKQQDESVDRQIDHVPYTRFVEELGIRKEELDIESDLVFVLMPFHDRFIEVFDVIAKTCRSVGLKCVRGDEEHVGEILPHLLRLLMRSRVVIALIEGRNPNVYYELGIAHALDKNTILVSRSLRELPFDLRSKRILLYSTLDDLRDQLQLFLAQSWVASRENQ